MDATQGRPVYLSAKDARERIGVSRETLRKLIRDGHIRAHKSGPARNSHYRISEQAVADYIEQHTVKAAS